MLIEAVACPAPEPAANRLVTLAQPSRAILDIETRSACDLKAVGAYVYAAHSSTSITHFGFKLDDGPTIVWRPSEAPMPVELLAALADPTVTLVAHNAGFERVLLTSHAGRAIGVPIEALQNISRWSCTAARAPARLGYQESWAGFALH